MPRFLPRRKAKADVRGKRKRSSNNHLIELHNVVKVYKTDAGDFVALKGIDLEIGAGEFVAVIGKSGSGKSTLINMIAGIDRPTRGEVYVTGTPIHTLSEGQMAEWRGRNLGVVFQFFQLLPTLTVVENVMLPMDFCNMYSPSERHKRAMHLLGLVGVAEHAYKMPSEVSGGQQQRVAIARALANNPPIIVADEPTGNLDSHTSEQVFQLFEALVARGKTVLMVTHDSDQAKRVKRTVVISDGAIIEECLTKTFPSLTERQLVEATGQLERQRYAPGSVIIQEGAPPNGFYIITGGEVEVMFQSSDGQEYVVANLGAGQYFGEIELLRGGASIATVRAARGGVEVVALDRKTFARLMTESETTRGAVEQVVRERIVEHGAGRRKAEHEA